MVTYELFVSAFPEFADTTAYPRAVVEFWMTQAPQFMNVARLGAKVDLATMLFTAHMMAFARMAAKQAASGGVIGQYSGAVQSKGMDGVNVSYDTNSVTSDGAGQWNATTYGMRLWPMLKGTHLGPVYRPAPGLRSRMPWD